MHACVDTETRQLNAHAEDVVEGRQDNVDAKGYRVDVKGNITEGKGYRVDVKGNSVQVLMDLDVVRRLRATGWTLRAIVRRLRAKGWTSRAIVPRLRATGWTLRVKVRMLRATERTLR
eukprot:513009-Pyramimonas_sp.AAC.1